MITQESGHLSVLHRQGFLLQLVQLQVQRQLMQGNEGKIAGNALRGITADVFLLAADQFVVSQVGEIEGRKDSSPHHSP